ncbi:MAG: hypothetical protein JWM82_4470 [Myxococcales bacterium]|nr:hypothetical protein [Myxococcales bacterium]
MNPPAPAPRRFRVSALDSSTTFQLLFGGIWAFVGLTLSVVFTMVGGPFWNDLALDSRGVRAEATPTDVSPTSSRINGRRMFKIEYSFADAASAAHSGACGTTNVASIARAEQRQPLEIEYDPARPALSRLRGESASFFGLFVLFPFAFFVVGAILVSVGMRRALRLRVLYIGGRAALATVTGVAATYLRINQRPLLRVEYAFDTPVGRATGHTTTRHAPPVGSELWILHDPHDPMKNIAA